MNTAGCPVSEELKALVQGQLAPDDEARLSQHLDSCTDCQQRLERVAGQTELLHDVQKKLGDSDNNQSPDMATVINQFRSDIAAGRDRDETEAGGWGDEFPTTAESEFDLEVPKAITPDSIDGIEIVEELGRGGMGVVYKGYERSLDRFVAIKMLARRLAAVPEACERFTREARSLAAVRHRHIVSIFRIVDPFNPRGSGTPPCLVMEYVRGESLEQRIRRKGRLKVREVIRSGIQIAAGLSAAHERDLIHRDIKPANILRERSSKDVKLTDFGLARAVDDIALTQSGTLVGTPAFMSPEQADGARLDHRSDLFSFGSVLYAMLTGHPPFSGSSPTSTMKQILNDSPVPIEEFRDDVPEWLLRIISRLHEKDPTQRYQSAEEVLWLLQEGRAEQLQPAQSERQPASVTETARRQSTIRDAPSTPPVNGPVARTNAWSIISMVVAGMLILAALLEVTGVFDRASQESGSSTVAVNRNSTTDRSEIDSSPILGVDRNGVEGIPGELPKISVLVGGQADGQPCESIGQAVAQAPDGATILLNTNGPLFTPPLHVQERTLTIQAAEGFRPELVLGQRLRDDERALIESSGQLRLLGLVLTVPGRRSDTPGETPLSAVLCRGGSLRMANCRLSVQNGEPCLKLDGTTDSTVQNCELFSAGGAGIDWKPASDAKLIVRNTLQAGLVAVALRHQTTDVGQPELRLEKSSMSTFHAVQLIVPTGASRDSDKGQPVKVFAGHCLLDVRDSVLQFDVPEDQLTATGPFHPWEVPERIRAAISWQDHWTLFGEPNQFMSWLPASEKSNWPPWTPKHQFGWSRFWDLPVPPKSVNETVRFVSGRPTRNRQPLPVDIALQFRVVNQFPEEAGERTPGVDPLIVGPGEAFDRWRRTPAWRTWQHQ